MKDTISFLENEKAILNDQFKNIFNDNKSAHEKLRNMNDYSQVKSDGKALREKLSQLETENLNLKIQNQNLENNVERLRDSLVETNRKNDRLKQEVK